MSTDKDLHEALDMSKECIESLSKPPRKFDFETLEHYSMYKHDKKPGTLFCSREDCVRSYAKNGAKRIAGFNSKGWREIELREYEVENMRKLKLIEIQKKRYAKGRYKI